jgi:hypothetical protein
MLPNSVNVGPTSPDVRPSDPPKRDGQLAHLLEVERMWFSWVSVLHERLGKPDMKADGHDVLEIARKRWLEAKDALRRHQAGP